MTAATSAEDGGTVQAAAALLDTAGRATALERAASAFPQLGRVDCESLLELVETELGHREALDRFFPYGGESTQPLRTRAIASRCILHVLSRNTPLAGLQSLIRGVLLGSENLVKLPSSDLPEIGTFVAGLPAALRDRIVVSTQLDPAWLRRADAVVVFGDDDTLHHFRTSLRADQVFVPHGHRISFAVLFDDPDGTAASLAARDIGLYNQQGCLSPHVIYVAASHDGDFDARGFAEKLAIAMTAYEAEDPRGTIPAAAAAEIGALRDSYRFRQANDDRVALWCSEGGSEWTVIYEDDPQFAVSPLNRVIFVKPLPQAGLDEDLRLVRRHLGSIALHPFTDAHAESLASLGASRLCALGDAQRPHLLWHQDGQPQLSPFVTWQDIG